MNLSRIALILLVENVAKRSARDLSDELGGNLASGTLLSIFLNSVHPMSLTLSVIGSPNRV